MLSAKDKEFETYNLMYERYIELKVILSYLSVNLAELDKIKAQILQRESTTNQGVKSLFCIIKGFTPF